MHKALCSLLSLGLLLLFTYDSPAQTGSAAQNKMTVSSGVGAPLFNNLGSYHHEITTSSPQAQRYFDQGLTLTYGFNHGEAIRSFKEASRLDPDCAMCYWGVALALGPNINKPMADEDVPKAWEALQKAKELARKASPRELAYIKALEARYSSRVVDDRRALDLAYANAMREVMKTYPDDLDAATLFAEALMDTIPWNYYTEDGRPKAVTKEIVGALESVISRYPQHPGANHLYIHAVEASPYPERGLASAARLADIAPGAGHLVHMPSHIYLRLGRYHDATLANQRAVSADQAYIAQCNAQGFYPVAYYPHNRHFLWYTAGEEGRSQLAIDTAREIERMSEMHPLKEGRRFSPLLVLTLARFGKWDEVLAAPQPPNDRVFATAMWHYARGRSHAARLDFDLAQKELDALNTIAATSEIASLDQANLPGGKLILVSKHALAGELAGQRGRSEDMKRLFSTAIELEDKLPYMEPPYWHHPVRQLLGAALMKEGRFADAESVYREDLRRHPANGWSLYGLLSSLREQGKFKEAEKAHKSFREAWRLADITLTASTF